MANYEAKRPESADTPSADPPPEPTKNVLTTTQWLSVISIIVSLAGIYYKREEIKDVFATPHRHEPPHHRLPHQEELSVKWIRLYILFDIMDKFAFIGGFMGAFAFFVVEEMYYRFIRNDKESFWESRQFEDS